MTEVSASRSAKQHRHKKPSDALGDFTTTPRVLPISLMAIVIGFISSGVAWFLLKLIGFFTNLFYYQRISTALSSPAGNHLGVFAIAVPVIGSLIVGLMARYGSERIRGHGIPEAIESILMNGSRVHYVEYRTMPNKVFRECSMTVLNVIVVGIIGLNSPVQTVADSIDLTASSAKDSS